MSIFWFLCLFVQPIWCRPNIVYILTDDFGYADISAKGAEFNTPNLDDLYSNSIELTSHYIGLMCSATRTQILTGRYAWNLALSEQNVFSFGEISGVPVGVPTLANFLRYYANYKTYALGKWQLGYSTHMHTAQSRGFDEFAGFYISTIFYTNKTSTANHVEYYVDWWKNGEINWDSMYQYSTYATRDEAIDIIDRHGKQGLQDQEEPFFMYLAFQATHDPLSSVESIDELNCKNIGNINRYIYCLNVMALDESIGDIISRLKYNNLYNNTLIIFTSDNGASYHYGGCNYPYRGNKKSFFEGGIKTIALVSGGYVDEYQRGTKRDEFMHASDWTPTLMSIAGIDSEFEYDNHEYMSKYPLDGYDLSQWLLHGDKNSNPRDNVGLSINKFDGENSIVVVFESEITGHRYKFMMLPSVGTNAASWCEYGWNDTTQTKYRYEVSNTSDVEGVVQFLYDLTLDHNETTNLKNLHNNNDNNNNYKYVNKTSITHQQNANGNKIKIARLDDYFDKNKIEMNTIDLVGLLWDEGIVIVALYQENELFNQYSDCQFQWTSQADPSNFEPQAWQPWLDFNEYVSNFSQNCQDSINSALFDLYVTPFVW